MHKYSHPLFNVRHNHLFMRRMRLVTPNPRSIWHTQKTDVESQLRKKIIFCEQMFYVRHSKNNGGWCGAICIWVPYRYCKELLALQWRHNERNSVSNHQPHDCLLKRLFRCRSKVTSKSTSPTFVRGIQQWPVKSPHKGPVTGKMIRFGDVIKILKIKGEMV